MKLLTFQPFSVYESSGGSRILRRLFEGKEPHVHSVATTIGTETKKKGAITETVIAEKPLHKKWMKSVLRKVEKWMREQVFFKSNVKTVQKVISNTSFDVLHIVDHGALTTGIINLYEPKKINSTPLWVSFHDHFATSGSTKEICSKLWQLANRRLVISKEMGNEYQRLFGNQNYEIITDGVDVSELSEPKPIVANKKLSLYFAGLLHIDYLPLFQVLADALDELTKEGLRIEIILRGTQQVSFLQNRLFIVTYRPSTLDSSVLKDELDATDILYLPIKFTNPNFYLYSLSTKMIGYLGASGTILYHGPKDSAACKLLTENNAAVTCVSLIKSDLIKAIQDVVDNQRQCSVNSKLLAKEKFLLADIQNKFWLTEFY